ncbi:MAG: DNA polymerase III subunit beta [Cellvibrionales bacterium UBA7375]|nr:DNA polymerase III subunit beta [Porticoccaceae bacterium]RPG82177.1 MAG: DNA polymerase III subunit beta [Cellvibrionales bacterium TMED47]CAI8320875.1 MAG: DNA polymerase III subunit beta [Cellvibrionales bacterium UBA7375]|tara:strand:+ start:6033 stop:7133 length:1101 start_codon:yes stop_codon:yes gene_type:complete
MKFSLSREALLNPLQLVVGVVERRQTLPILSNVLLSLEGNLLSMTGTDLEVEIKGSTEVVSSGEAGEVTVSARKFLDICRSLPDGAQVDFSSSEGKAQIVSGRSRFSLATLPANEFPSVDEGEQNVEFSVSGSMIRGLIDSTSFAMAQQDVRYYLNGMLWEVTHNQLRVVATDGHRLALCDGPCEVAVGDKISAILPRKGIIELSRLLADDEARVSIGSNHIRVTGADYCFTSKLVDGSYPDYDRVVPKGGNKLVVGDREQLKQAFGRTAILSNEKYRGVTIQLVNGAMHLAANNPEQEEAQEEVSVAYSGDSLEIGFNVSYLLDVLNVLKSKEIRFTLADSNSSALVEDASGASKATYVVMPMRL